MRARQTIGILGAVVLAIGALAPVMRVPIVGGVSLMQSDTGHILLATAGVSLLATLV